LAELIGTQPLEWWLEKEFAEHKNSWFQKNLTCADSACTTGWMAWYRKKTLAISKCTAQCEQDFEFNVS
jgi:hypothetical protein